MPTFCGGRSRKILMDIYEVARITYLVELPKPVGKRNSHQGIQHLDKTLTSR